MNVVFNYMNLYLMFLCIVRASMIMQIHLFMSISSIHAHECFYICLCALGVCCFFLVFKVLFLIMLLRNQVME